MDASAQIDVQVLTVLSGALIPLLVGLVSKRVTSRGVKAVLNALLSAIAGGLALAIAAEGNVDNVRSWVLSIGTTWVISVATYYGFWKPTGVTPAIQDSTSEFGI